MKKLILIFLLIPASVFSQHGVQSPFNRIQLKDIYHVFGGFQDSSVTVSISVQGTFYMTTNDENDLFAGSEADGFTLSGDTLIQNFDGDVFGYLAINFEGNANQEYHFRVWNETQSRTEGFELGDTGRGNNNYAKFAGPVYLEGSAGDEYILQVSNESGTGDCILKHCQFFMCYLHD